jgi:hypothetical protein
MGQIDSSLQEDPNIRRKMIKERSVYIAEKKKDIIEEIIGQKFFNKKESDDLSSDIARIVIPFIGREFTGKNEIVELPQRTIFIKDLSVIKDGFVFYALFEGDTNDRTYVYEKGGYGNILDGSRILQLPNNDLIGLDNKYHLTVWRKFNNEWKVIKTLQNVFTVQAQPFIVENDSKEFLVLESDIIYTINMDNYTIIKSTRIQYSANTIKGNNKILFFQCETDKITSFNNDGSKKILFEVNRSVDWLYNVSKLKDGSLLLTIGHNVSEENSRTDILLLIPDTEDFSKFKTQLIFSGEDWKEYISYELKDKNIFIAYKDNPYFSIFYKNKKEVKSFNIYTEGKHSITYFFELSDQRIALGLDNGDIILFSKEYKFLKVLKGQNHIYYINQLSNEKLITFDGRKTIRLWD